MSESKQILDTIINDFSVEKFNRFFREKNRQYTPINTSYSHYNDNNFKNGLKLGEINFSDSDNLIICAFEVKIELSERAGKKAQYEKAKTILKSVGNQKFSAGIFIFYDSNGNFRFSLIYPESTGTHRQWNNFRRFTYFVSKTLTNKTFKQRIGDGNFSNLTTIKEVFSVEKVTKEFFNNYKKLYEKLVQYLEQDKAFDAFASQKGVEIKIFAKKLLGQLVFIYFLQKKGWLGAKKNESISEGQHNFTRNLFVKCQNNNHNFFNDYLEYLFYDCLNRQPEKAATFYRERFDCQIPFLNGGLFEPINDYNWKEEFINIPNEIFSNKEETGILDTFEQYNFTIDENTPDDQEVSVDPEMLGKVFENLLEDNIRKGQGAFYTPREIVHYMCKESLLNYLITNSSTNKKSIKNYFELADQDNEDVKAAAMFEGEAVEIDNLLGNIQVCDPACGSGAFLIGMLNEIIKLRVLVRVFHPNKFKNTSIYHLKKETIQNCLYGVDIDPGAIDIAKLRFWLSIVVDENIEDVEPLPNLDYKIMQGNSLLENLVIGDDEIIFNFDGKNKIDKRTKEMKNLFEKNSQGKLFFDKSETLVEKLEKYHSEYFSITDPDKKKILKKNIDSIEDELIQSKCQEEIEKADSVIKNNPNDNKKILKNTQKILAIKETLNKWKKDHLRPFFPWKLHFGEIFNKENPGFDIVIANPPYYRSRDILPELAESYKKTYNYTKSGFDLATLFLEFAEKNINSNGSISFIVTNKIFSSRYSFDLRKHWVEEKLVQQVVNLYSHLFENTPVETSLIILTKNNKEIKYNSYLKKRINKIKNFQLKNYIKPSIYSKLPNYIFLFPSNAFEFSLLNKLIKFDKTISTYFKISAGYGITGIKNNLSVKQTKEYNLPVFSGKCIWRYRNLSSEYYANTFKKFNTFSSNQVVIRELSTKNRATIITNIEKAIALNSITIAETKDKNISEKIFLAIFNSRLFNIIYTLLYESTRTHSNLRYKALYLNEIPFPDITKINQGQIVDLVNRILIITKSHDYLENLEKQNQVKKYEKQIDQMVYKLYGLTSEEIKIIEIND